MKKMMVVEGKENSFIWVAQTTCLLLDFYLGAMPTSLPGQWILATRLLSYNLLYFLHPLDNINKKMIMVELMHKVVVPGLFIGGVPEVVVVQSSCR